MSDVKMALEVRAHQYQAMLQEAGYAVRNPEWEQETRCWDMRIRFEGASCVLLLDADDPRYVRIVLPNFLDLASEQIGAGLIAADLANKTCKGAKVYLNRARNDVIAAVEMLEPAAGIDCELLMRNLQMLLNAAKVYAAGFRQQLAEAA